MRILKLASTTQTF